MNINTIKEAAKKIVANGDYWNLCSALEYFYEYQLIDYKHYKQLWNELLINYDKQKEE